MTWTSQGTITLPSFGSDWILQPGGPADKLFAYDPSGGSARRYTLNAARTTATLDSLATWSDTAGQPFLVYDATATYAWYFTTDFNCWRFTVGTGTDALASATQYGRTYGLFNVTDHLFAIANNRFWMFRPTRSDSRAFDIPSSPGTDSFAFSSYFAGLVAGANYRGLSNIRFLSDGTYLWVTGTNNSNLTAVGYCYETTVAEGQTRTSRVPDRDFSVTRTSAIRHLTMNAGGEIYLVSGSSAERFTFVAVVPSGTVANQTGTPGVVFSFDLDDDITGATSYSVRNTSLDGTGLSLDTTTGVLSGTPTSSHVGAHTIELTATSTAGTYDFSFTFTVARSLPTGTVDAQVANSQTLFSLNLDTDISGNPLPTYSERNNSFTGTGLSLGSTRQRVLSGRPSRSQVGSHTIEIRASNASGNYDFSFSFTVRSEPQWSTVPAQTHEVDTALSFDVSSYIDGSPQGTVSLTAGQTNPTGLSVDGTRVKWTPSSTGTFTVYLTATNPAGSANTSFSITVVKTPSGSVANQTGTPGVAFSHDISDDITGTPNPTFSVRSSSLAGTGLSLNATTGVLSGTPTSSHVGAHTILLRATNAGGTYDFSFTFTVARSLPTGTVPNQTATALTAFSLDLSALITGTPSPTSFTVRNSSLDGTGLALSGTSPTGKTLSGTPSRAQSGDHTIELRATNASGNYDFSFTLTVRKRPFWASIQTQTHAVNTPFSLDVASFIDALPTATVELTVGRTNPTGLSVDGTTVKWTPTATGDYTVYITARNSAGVSNRTFIISVVIPNAQPSGSVADMTVYTTQSVSIALADFISGHPAVSFTVRNTSLPSWLTLSGTTLSGTPTTAAAAHTVQLTASNGIGTDLDFEFDITVLNGLAPSWSTTGLADSVQVATSLLWNVSTLESGTPAPDLSFAAGYTKPSWLTLTGTTLSGTPPQSSYPSETSLPIRLLAKNVVGEAEVTLTLWVTQTAPAAPAGSVSTQTTSEGTKLDVNLASSITGPPAPVFSVQPGEMLPTGVTLSGAGAFSWTPAASQVGAHTIKLRAVNAEGMLDFDLSVTVTGRPTEPVWVASQLFAVFYRGANNNYDLNRFVSGLPTPVVTALTSPLPRWMTLSAGVITGNPVTLHSTGSPNTQLRVRAENTEGRADAVLLWRVAQGQRPTITAIPAQTAYRTVRFMVEAELTGPPTPNVTFKAGSSPPSWLSIAVSARFLGEGTVRLTGTPPAGETASTYTVTLVASNTISPDAETSFTLTISDGVAPVWNLPTEFVPGVNYAFSFDLNDYVTGIPSADITLKMGETLPAWMTLTDGVLAGTPPTSITTETEMEVEVTATNRVLAVDATVQLRIVLPGAPVWQADPLPTFVVDWDDESTESFDLKPYQYSYPPATYASTTRLFNWESLSDGVFTVDFSRRGAGGIGSYRTRSFDATNVHGTDTKALTYLLYRTGMPDPRPLHGREFQVTVGEAFRLDVAALFGGNVPVNFRSVIALPSWLTLSNGVLTGTLPDEGQMSQRFSMQIRAQNAVASGGTIAQFTIVSTAPAIPSWILMTLGDGIASFPWSVDLTDFLRGSPFPTLTFTQGYTAPAWLELDGTELKSTRLPTLARDTDYQIQLTATNTAGSADITLTLRVLVGGQPRIQYVEEDIAFFDSTTRQPYVRGVAVRAANDFYYWRTDKLERMRYSGTRLTTRDAIEDAPEQTFRLFYALTISGNSLYFGAYAGGDEAHIYRSDFATFQSGRYQVQTSTAIGTLSPSAVVWADGHLYIGYWSEATFRQPMHLRAWSFDGVGNIRARVPDRDFMLDAATWSVAFDDVLKEFIITDHVLNLFYRVDLEGNRTGWQLSFREVFDRHDPGAPDSELTNRPRIGVAGLDWFDGDLWVSYFHVIETVGQISPYYIARLNLQSPYWADIPTQVLGASDGFELRLDLTQFTTGTPTLYADQTLPAGIAVASGQLTWDPPPSERTRSQRIVLQSTRNDFPAYTTMRVTFEGLTAAPVWSATIGVQEVVVGLSIAIDLESLLTAGDPEPDFTLMGTFPSWLLIRNGILGGIPPIADYPSATTLSVNVRATNSQGSADATLQIRITTELTTHALPAWRQIPQQQAVVGRRWSLDLSPLVVANPAATFEAVDTAPLPAWLSITGTILSGIPPASITRQQDVSFGVGARNPIGTADTTIILRVFLPGEVTFLSNIEIESPAGLTLATAAANDTRIFVAALAPLSSLPSRILVYDWDGQRKLAEEFDISTPRNNFPRGFPGRYGVRGTPTIGFGGMQVVGQNIYLVEQMPYEVGAQATPSRFIGRVRIFSLQGVEQAGFGIPLRSNAPIQGAQPFEQFFSTAGALRSYGPRGIVHEGERFWVGVRFADFGTRQDLTWRVVPFATGGEQGSTFEEISLGSQTALYGITEDERHFLVLGGGQGGSRRRIGRFTKAFAYIPEQDIDLETRNSDGIGIAYGNGRIVVVDANDGLFFYGSPVQTPVEQPPVPRQPTAPIPTFLLPTVAIRPGVTQIYVGVRRQFEGMENWVRYFDILRPSGQGATSTPIALGVEAILESALEYEQIQDVSDVPIARVAATVIFIPRYAIEGIAVNDAILAYSPDRTLENPGGVSGIYWTVQGVTQIGPDLHQEIVAIRSDAPAVGT